MFWVYILLAISAVAGALMEFYIRFLPSWKKHRDEKFKNTNIIRQELAGAISDVEDYNNVTFLPKGFHLESDNPVPSLEDVARDAGLPSKTVSQLVLLEGKTTENYHQWLRHCCDLVKMAIKAESKELPTLDDTFMKVFGGPIENIMGTYGVLLDGDIFKATFDGQLTHEIAKASVLKNRWDNQVLKDSVEGKDFHKLVEELCRLQESESIESFRIARKDFLDKAQSILKGLPHS